jgi:ring-1,2-phenylacetyl-CoA epoxidase subunit PaaC
MIEIPAGISREPILRLLVAMADDELALGHRNSEWTGHAPILEEDIAFSNIAQDELGHALVWYTLQEQMGGKPPDFMGFERSWRDFTCCRFVTYPKGDFAYTLVRQYLFDEAEQVRLRAFRGSSFPPLSEIAGKVIREEAYHLMHVSGLVSRLGNATAESHRRMQTAVNDALPQASGMFEALEGENALIEAGVFPGNAVLEKEWITRVTPVLAAASLKLPANPVPDLGGRRGSHTPHLQQLVDDMQKVYRLAPGAKW